MSPTNASGKPYRRIARSKNLMGSSELYLGQHHVLYAIQEFASESYKRFYYDEILAIISVRTPEYLLINTITGTICLFSAAIFLLNLDEMGTLVFTGLLFGFALMVLISNLIHGPTCKTVIQTRVSREPILCLRRLRIRKKALPLLEQRILEAQPQLPVVDTPLSSAAPSETATDSNSVTV